MRASTRTPIQLGGLFLGPLAALLLLVFFDPDPARPQISYMMAVAVWMAIWWMTEAAPLAATSLLPFVLFPILGILDAGEVAASYINPIIFLFLGGFLIALAMESWNLHRRIALGIISSVGSSLVRLSTGVRSLHHAGERPVRQRGWIYPRARRPRHFLITDPCYTRSSTRDSR